MIRIANGGGFWGDSVFAPKELLTLCPELDFLTLDYLAELSLSIMASAHIKYAADFLEVLKQLPKTKCKIITNGGGLDPKGLAEACRKICPDKKIAYVTGDDVSSRFGVQANVYLGARPIVEALQKGADIVITGRVADPSLTLAPCLYTFGWSDFDKIAQGTVAGHLIECGAQCTGGISSDWLEVPHPESIGYPIVEVEESGEFVVTKPKNSGGKVSLETVKEQLLYELFDPDRYLSPDATVSFANLILTQEGPDRVRVRGARGGPPPADYKVSTARPIGYRVEGMVALFGDNVREKGLRAGRAVIDRVKVNGFSLEEAIVELIGSGSVVPLNPLYENKECMIRIAAFDKNRAGLDVLAKEIAPLVTRGPQGIAGYAGGRPKVREVFSFEPQFIPRSEVSWNVSL